jgi:hypothetical protein
MRKSTTPKKVEIRGKKSDTPSGYYKYARIIVYLTKEEKADVDKRAKAANKKTVQFVREALGLTKRYNRNPKNANRWKRA